MTFTEEDRKRGGKTVVKRYGSKHMSKIGKKGRKKQLAAQAEKEESSS